MSAITPGAVPRPGEHPAGATRRAATPAPRRTSSARFLGPLLAVAVIALGVTGVQHLAVERGWTEASSWLRTALDRPHGLEPSVPVLILAVVVGTIGLALVWSAISPPRRSHRLADTSEGDDVGVVDLWVDGSATRDLVADVVDRCAGVLDSDVGLRRGGKVVVAALVLPGSARQVKGEIAEAVADRLRDLAPRRLVVKVREEVA